MKPITVDVVSIETIRPFTRSVQDRHVHLTKIPFKICLLDQIVPRTYVPYVFFYPAQQNYQNAHTFSTRIKTSLSDTLARFYPFSGRLQNDNLSIHEFHKGVPFKEARVNSQLSDFLTNPSRTIMSSLNRFLPLRPLSDEKSHPDMPQLAAQLTRFSCGGVAIGMCVNHKLSDVATSVAFFNRWAATTRGESSLDHDLDLHGASLRFPAVDSLPQHHASMYEKSWFGRGNWRTERFVFDEEALATLKSKTRSDAVPNPTRVQALSALIWKATMDASRTISSNTSPRTHVMSHVVNIRPRHGKNNVTAMGNLLLFANAVYKVDYATNVELSGLVKLVSESISKVNNEYMRSIGGSEGVDLVMGYLKMMEEVVLKEEPEVIGFSSWVNMGLEEVDFGLGKPIWVGVSGGEEEGQECGNFITVNDASWCGRIEAWVRLDEEVLDVMKNDPEFLAFATVDPPVPFLVSPRI